MVAVAALACGDAVPGGGCPSHADPSFELGTGEERFTSLQNGADLQMTRGSQGGCHFVLAFRTDGFAGDETLVLYRMDNETDGQEIIVSQQFIRLEEAPEPGRCQATNFIAFLVAPWNVEGDRVRIQVTLEEEVGSDTQVVEVVARWPDAAGGVDRDRLCGER